MRSKCFISLLHTASNVISAISVVEFVEFSVVFVKFSGSGQTSTTFCGVPGGTAALQHLEAFKHLRTKHVRIQHVSTCHISIYFIDPLLISFDLLSLCVCIFVSGVPWCSIMFFKKKLIKWLAFHKFVTLKAASLWYEDGQRGHWQHVLCCLDAIGCNARYAPICSLQDLDLTMFDLSSEDPELFELLWTKSLLQRRPTGAITCVIFCYHIQVHIVSRPWLGLVMRTVRLN